MTLARPQLPGGSSFQVPSFLANGTVARPLLDLNDGRLPSAVAAAERIEADLAAGLSLASTEDALMPHMSCHRIRAAAGDARAAAVLATAHTALQAMAARVGDDELMTCVLENIPLHREIVAAWRRR